MHVIHKKIVTDEKQHPVAVLIDYNDWLEIEKLLKQEQKLKQENLSRFSGIIKLTEDPVEFQSRIRDEWK